jgi:hypothetical protein
MRVGIFKYLAWNITGRDNQKSMELLERLQLIHISSPAFNHQGSQKNNESLASASRACTFDAISSTGDTGLCAG